MTVKPVLMPMPQSMPAKTGLSHLSGVKSSGCMYREPGKRAVMVMRGSEQASISASVSGRSASSRLSPSTSL